MALQIYYDKDADLKRIQSKKVAIIGSGPAGYSAAIYAARADLKPVMYEGPLPGGQLTQTTEVDNYPGYPEGRSGPEMMEDLKKQALRFNTDVRHGWVTKVDFSGPVHKVWVDEKTEIHADAVIISTGASAKTGRAGAPSGAAAATPSASA